jgi:hypothetical protein
VKKTFENRRLGEKFRTARWMLAIPQGNCKEFPSGTNILMCVGNHTISWACGRLDNTVVGLFIACLTSAPAEAARL